MANLLKSRDIPEEVRQKPYLGIPKMSRKNVLFSGQSYGSKDWGEFY
jgi:hypothetical protein